mmetsp:Transcript_25391/g.69967  ORF Transcript_25391/g.69967 Transcript_25391/m.69967 type:complete len:208 (+) Transcript_25391:377-1000(+)
MSAANFRMTTSGIVSNAGTDTSTATPKTMVPRHGCIIQRIFLQHVRNGASHTQEPMAAMFARTGQTRTSSTKLFSIIQSINRDVPVDVPRSQISAGISLSRKDKETSGMKSEAMPPYSNRKSGKKRAGNHNSVENNANSYSTTRFHNGIRLVWTDIFSAGLPVEVGLLFHHSFCRSGASISATSLWLVLCCCVFLALGPKPVNNSFE